MYAFYIIFFLISLSIGSFINVIVTRLDRKGGIFWGRSECTYCYQQLRWHDLIPILSFIFLRGKCRYCKKKISFLYPVGEAGTAIILTSYLWFNGFSFTFYSLIDLAILAVLIALFLFDFKYFILPDKLVLTLISLGLLNHILPNHIGVFGPIFFWQLLYGFILSLPFVILYMVSRGRWLGLGDAKLLFALGIIFGFKLGLLAVTTSVWLAAILGIVMMMFHRATLKTALPFGSFLAGISIILIIFKPYAQIFIDQIFI